MSTTFKVGDRVCFSEKGEQFIMHNANLDYKAAFGLKLKQRFIITRIEKNKDYYYLDNSSLYFYDYELMPGKARTLIKKEIV